MEPLVYFLGRLHPMLVHAPIGMLIGLIVLEVAFKVRRSALHTQLDHTVRIVLLFLIASSCIAAIVTGLIRRDEEGYGSFNADLHQWLGIGLGVVLIASCLAAARRALKTYAIMLLLAAGLITAAGHFGASLTHGANFLTEPFITRVPKPLVTQPKTNATEPVNESATTAAAPISNAQANSTPPATLSQFQLTVAPILENHCISCHGPTKVKGSLRLDSPESILKGGDVGPAMLTAAPLDSPILTRLLLPLDDDDHMPPDSRPQPTAAEIETIRAWLASGGSFTAPAPSTHPLPTPTPITNNTPSATAHTPILRPARPEPATHPDPSALAAIRAALIHIAPVSQHSTLYDVDVAAIAPTIDDAAIEKLLTPVLTNIAHLNLARSRIGQPTLALTARMPHLTKLDLSGTPIDDAALAALANHPTLESLTITRTAISDPAPLLTLPALTHLYCWNTRLSDQAIASLRAKPGLTLNSGTRPAPTALETEPPPILAKSSDTPPPPPTPDLKPINTLCPVSNKPIDATKLVVYQGRVVGLCCEHCAEAFLADPEKYAGKLPKP